MYFTTDRVVVIWGHKQDKLWTERENTFGVFFFFPLDWLGELEKTDKSLFAQELAYFVQLYQLV